MQKVLNTQWVLSSSQERLELINDNLRTLRTAVRQSNLKPEDRDDLARKITTCLNVLADLEDALLDADNEIDFVKSVWELTREPARDRYYVFDENQDITEVDKETYDKINDPNAEEQIPEEAYTSTENDA